jgi:isochorismate hydrolase
VIYLKKERYFTPQNIQAKTEQLLLDYVRPSQASSFPFTPEKSALLVLDLQDYFLDAHSHAYIPSAAAIIPGINQLIDAYAQHDLQIFFTRHINDIHNSAMMARWWRDLITADNPLGQISADIHTSKGVIIEKSQYDGFYQTDLDQRLQEKRVTQLVITGVMTHLCCETTARAAFTRGLEVFFPIDGTATYHETYHRASLQNLAHGFAVITTLAQLLDQIKGTQNEG